MENFFSVLVNVWREACQHIKLGESTPNITALLQKDLALDQLLVKSVSFESKIIETVALGFPEKELEVSRRCNCSETEMRRLQQLFNEQNVYIGLDFSSMSELSFMFNPEKQTGQVMIYPFKRGRIHGILVFAATPGHRFTDRSKMLMQTLLEPFSVAMENDERLLELTRLRKAAEADNQSLLSRLGREDIVDAIVGQNSGLKSVVERIELISNSNLPVLILGETGTGKELIARKIHDHSSRINRPFLRVNCGAIPTELVDSQLFGHVKGAFTGALTNAAGWFERADGGTLFLDEIGELPLAAQVRFLRVLQDGWFERVGDNKSIHVDVRIIAATNQDLATMITAGEFREDLWYRIAVFPVILPPLRQRKEDIADLAEHFVKRASSRFKLSPIMPTNDDIAILQSYDWPGNIREFASVIDRAVILGNGKSLEISKSLGWTNEYSCTPFTPNSTTPIVEPKALIREAVSTESVHKLDDVARVQIERILHQTKGRIDGPHGAALILGINPHTLRGRMRKLGIDWKAKRKVCV
jgi:hydrogenase-4 transcriptional activator